MRVALFDDYIPGVVVDDRIIDLRSVVGEAIMGTPKKRRMISIIERFSELEDRIRDAMTAPGVPLSEVNLRAPVPLPGKMLFGLGNYREGTEVQLPLNLYVKSSQSVLDPGDTVRLIPHDAVIFHHEAELAFVVSRRARNVSADEAMDFVFGYTSVIDVSARGLGGDVTFINKSADTFCPMGPWITTREDIPDPQALTVRLSVDGVLRQEYNTRDMDHPVREIVAWASRVLTLEPGDVVACGVNHQGVGPLQDGETATIEIDRIGPMSVHVADSRKRKWPVGIDPGIGKAALALRVTGEVPPFDEMFPWRSTDAPRSQAV
jgi:2-keto-4-pentenoate hydratase/2-oxohepta-3-ene-1,7-dioic acid hydratase in catechol pathway